MSNFQSRQFKSLLLFLAIVCVGYVASLFLVYSFVVMPGLATLDDGSFVAAFQGLETRFQNADQLPGYEPFGYGNIPALIAFPGSIIFCFLSIVFNQQKSYLKWIVAAFILFIIGMISTVMYNLPSNEAIFTAGDPHLIDATMVRKQFNEAAWLNSNHFRASSSSLSVFCLLRALYLHLIDVGRNAVRNGVKA